MPEPKNILLITSDQQHWFTLGCLNPEIDTPNLDRLAAQGVLYNRAYCPNPTCTPTRASMITGRYPSQHGAWALGTKLPESEHTIGMDFRAAGRRSALIGKAHFQQLLNHPRYPSLESNPLQSDLDFWREFNGPFYGFEHVELARNHTNEFHAGQHYGIWMEAQGFTEWRDHFMDLERTKPKQQHRWTLPEEYHYNRWIAERTNAMMAEYAERGDRFLLWASFLDPHPPYLVPEPWDTMYDPADLTIPERVPGEHENNPPHFKLTQQEAPDYSDWQEPEGQGMHGFTSHVIDPELHRKNIAVYYGMVSMMDKYIGRILDKLDALGLADDTVVVFTTDHGHFMGQHGLIAKGAFHYEDMIRVPFIVRDPDSTLPGGTRSDALQSLVDLAPTMLSAAGLPIPRSMTGVDQRPVWLGEAESARDHVIVENHHQPTTIHVKTYVNDRYKLTVYYNRAYGELFDLDADPRELNNLWDRPEHAALKADLVMKLLHAEMGKEPLWMPRVWGA